MFTQSADYQTAKHTVSGFMVTINVLLYIQGPASLSGIQNSQIPVFRVYFTIQIRRKNSGPRVAFGGDKIPVLSDSGILKLYCTMLS